MLSLSLDDHRCSNCDKLLFKGALGMGLVEVKCPRCGVLSPIHSFDNFLKSKPSTYIIMFNSVGKIIAASKSATRILGKAITNTHHIHDIQPDLILPSASVAKNSDPLLLLEEWQHAYQSLPNSVTHIGADGKKVDVSVRYYPVAGHLHSYVVGVYYAE